MGKYAISTTDKQEEGIDYALKLYNANLPIEEQLVKTEFVQQDFNRACEDRCTQLKNAKIAALIAAYVEGDEKKQVKFDSLTK